MSETFSKVEVITGVERRRRFATEQKMAIVARTTELYDRSAITPNKVFFSLPDCHQVGAASVRSTPQILKRLKKCSDAKLIFMEASIGRIIV